jgi:N-acetyl-anhydromuramyl-L-alanine amidase AmpD
MNFLEWTEAERQALAEEGALMNSAESVRYIVVHCSATRENQDYSVSQLESDHRKRGFRKIGYHFYIRKDGTVTQHRYLLEVGAHCRPHNRCSIGVCYEGGLNTEGEPTDTRTFAQRQQLQDLILILKRMFPQAIVMGHRDMPGARACDCPCFDATREYGKLSD